MPDERHGFPQPTRYCRACAKVVAVGEPGGGRRWELCWRCAEEFYPDQLPEIQEKCVHGPAVPSSIEHDDGVCHRTVEQCEGCGLKYVGEWVVCDCPHRNGEGC